MNIYNFIKKWQNRRTLRVYKRTKALTATTAIYLRFVDHHHQETDYIKTIFKIITCLWLQYISPYIIFIRIRGRCSNNEELTQLKLPRSG
jgi:hypothetical protein